MSRQSYSKEFKARVALDAIKVQKTVREMLINGILPIILTTSMWFPFGS